MALLLYAQTKDLCDPYPCWQAMTSSSAFSTAKAGVASLPPASSIVAYSCVKLIGRDFNGNP
jgi:hypothetical protein